VNHPYENHAAQPVVNCSVPNYVDPKRPVVNCSDVNCSVPNYVDPMRSVVNRFRQSECRENPPTEHHANSRRVEPPNGYHRWTAVNSRDARTTKKVAIRLTVARPTCRNSTAVRRQTLDGRCVDHPAHRSSDPHEAPNRQTAWGQPRANLPNPTRDGHRSPNGIRACL